MRTGRLTAKIGNNCIADGFQIYLHSFIVAVSGGSSAGNEPCKSAKVRDFVEEPYTAIMGEPGSPIMNLMPPLNIADDQGKILKSMQVSQLTAGKSVSLGLNADTDLTGTPRTEVHGFSVAPNGCHLVTNLEIIDNPTQRTLVVVGSEQTYPLSAATSASSRAVTAGR